MSSDGSDKLDEIYNAALKLDPAGRAVFLRQACGEDEELRAEIASLLDQDERLGSFMGKPAFDAVSASMNEEFLVGTLLGPYKVEGLLGAGGMGTVYRAQDTRLGRSVAIKMAAKEFSGRFLAEARAVASLSHPHVCTLYDIGPNYLVMELLEGETLDRRLRNGPLPLDRILNYAIEIADAMAAAHSRGIIHRDLKPGNIMVTAAGIKVLDFGLAQLVKPAAAALLSPKELSTETMPPRTDPGTVVGTAAYMSPEQARGEKLDTRTDLFSLGVVLYEMATGKRPFEGTIKAALFEAILNQPVRPVRQSNPTLPEKLDEIIQRALEKNRELRYQHAADLGSDLKRLAREVHTSLPPLTPYTLGALQERVLDAAIPSSVPVGMSCELLVQVRLVKSEGLRAVLLIEQLFDSTADDVQSKPFRMQFVRNSYDQIESQVLSVRVESKDFELTYPSKSIRIPADGDSEVCVFLVTAKRAGRLALVVEVLYEGVTVASRLLRTNGTETPQFVSSGTYQLATLPLTTYAYQPTASDSDVAPADKHSAANSFRHLFQNLNPSETSPASPAPTPPETKNEAGLETGEFTDFLMETGKFGSPAKPEAGPSEFTAMTRVRRPALPAQAPALRASPPPPAPVPVRRDKSNKVLFFVLGGMLVLGLLVVLFVALRK